MSGGYADASWTGGGITTDFGRLYNDLEHRVHALEQTLGMARAVVVPFNPNQPVTTVTEAPEPSRSTPAHVEDGHCVTDAGGTLWWYQASTDVWFSRDGNTPYGGKRHVGVCSYQKLVAMVGPLRDMDPNQVAHSKREYPSDPS